MIGRSGERGSGTSGLAARHDDDDDIYTRCIRCFQAFFRTGTFIDGTHIKLYSHSK